MYLLIWTEILDWSIHFSQYHQKVNKKQDTQNVTSWLRNTQTLNPFPNKILFLRVCSTSPLKTLWEKGKLLVMRNSSFSRSVFYLAYS